MQVEIVGTGHANAKLEVTQWFVVAVFHGHDIAEVGNGNPAFPIVFAVVKVVVADESVLQARGEDEFLRAVQSQSSGVDAHCGDIAAHGSSGIAHGDASSRAFIIGL